MRSSSIVTNWIEPRTSKFVLFSVFIYFSFSNFFGLPRVQMNSVVSISLIKRCALVVTLSWCINNRTLLFSPFEWMEVKVIKFLDVLRNTWLHRVAFFFILTYCESLKWFGLWQKKFDRDVKRVGFGWIAVIAYREQSEPTDCECIYVYIWTEYWIYV